MTRLHLLVALVMLFARPGQAQEAKPLEGKTTPSTGEIRGKVVISPKREAMGSQMPSGLPGRYSTHGSEGPTHQAASPSTNTSRLSERAVVYLESDELDRGTYPLPDKHPLLDQKDLQFHPQVLAILVGTTVDFPNRDNLFHNVFSYSEPKDFDLGRYPKDDSRSVTFGRPGTVRVYCDIHSHMNATILVLRHPYFAMPDEGGNYVIRNIPPGKYRIVLWYDRDAVERRTVEVPGDSSIEVDFTL
jgi:plastocyanin